MSEAPRPHRLTHGVLWKELAAGDAVGFALADWAYRRPIDDRPISRGELLVAPLEVKREVVRYWFLLNLQPHSLEGGPWFSFDSQHAGFDQAAFAPTPVLAIEAIDREFGSLLAPDLGGQIADEFPGEWMWREPPPSVLSTPQHEPTADDLLREILARLDALSSELRQWRTADAGHGEFGHNSGEEAPFTDEERETVLEVVAQSREAAVGRDWSGLVQAAQALQPFAIKLGKWLYRKFDLFTDEIAKKPWLIPLTYAAFQILKDIHSLEELIKLAALFK